MSRLAWYWHRLSAMGSSEVAQRLRKKGLEFVDGRRQRDWASIAIAAGDRYPTLPDPNGAPDSLRHALQRDAADILHGKWRAFGQLPVRVSDPPEWHTDHLVGVDLWTNVSAFGLDHRSLPKGADIKLIWELSRWHPLTRLAMAAYVLGDSKAAHKCLHWLEHWIQYNPPYRGWNWTSALESGIRLIQFTWIDALLRASGTNGEHETILEQLRYDLLPAHVWFTWRHRSFGSSANNHLLGELGGLVLATVRWPELSSWGTSLEELRELWEREVLAQFAEDGGNKEQALHYHLFSFELCWHVRQALRAAGNDVSSRIDERLACAVDFFVDVHGTRESWDYGDSDDASALPLCAEESRNAAEWCEWMTGSSGALASWLGATPGRQSERNRSGWRVWKESGLATARRGQIFLRFDLSPLGYLSTAAHGHCDALHLSLWLDDVAMIIDPGTGAYYGDKQLRAWLASRPAHNGPALPGIEEPKRAGPFLWSEGHAQPRVALDQSRITGELALSTNVLRREVSVTPSNEILVQDSVASSAPAFTVLWQFAPGAKCDRLDARRFRIARYDKVLEIRVGPDWNVVDLVATEPIQKAGEFEGTVSPRFRVTQWAPYLKLTGNSGAKPCLFTTTFLVSPAP